MDLAFAHVAFLVVIQVIFHSYRNRIEYRLRFLTIGAVVLAHLGVVVVRDALAPYFILARLLARREVGGFPRRLGVVPVDYVLVDAFLVAFDAIRHDCSHTGRGSR